MPVKDEDERRRRQRDQKRNKRLSAKIEKITGKPVAPPSAPAKPVGVSARDLDLEALAGEIMVAADKLSQIGWLNFRGAVGLQMVALAKTALSNLTITSVKDALALLQFGTTMVDQVVAATGQLGGDNEIPADYQEMHAALLADPLALEASQTILEVTGEIMKARLE